MIASASPLDGFAEAAGRILAKARRDWQAERELALAETRRTIAELEAKVATLSLQMHQMLTERMAGLKDGRDGEDGHDADPALIESLVEDAVGRAVAKIPAVQDGADADPELVAEIAAKRVSAELTEVIRADVEAIHADVQAIGAGIEGKVAAQVAAAVADIPVPKDGKDGEDGKSIDRAEIEGLIVNGITTAVAVLPLPENGKDADPALIAEMVAAEVAKLPPAEPGKSVDPDEVRALVATEVEMAVKSLPVPADGHTPTEAELVPLVNDAVSRAVSALPGPKDGEDGKSVEPGEVERVIAEKVAALPYADPEKVRAIIADLVEKAVADLPPPEPGAPGKSIDPADIEEMIRGEVERAVAKLPPAEPGKSITPADVADMLAAEVGAAVAALPVPQDGKSVEPAEVAAMVADAVAKLPPPERGELGPPGKLPAVKAWQRGVHYEGDARTHAGATYQALKDTAEEPPHEDWVCLAACGVAGEVPYVGEVYGLHEEGRKYRKFDLVHQNGSEWRARYDDPGPLPGDGWAMAAKVGDRPDPHKVQRWIALEVAKLPRPERGPAGPVIVEWVTQGYEAMPMMSDGKLGPALDLREFFEQYDAEKA